MPTARALRVALVSAALLCAATACSNSQSSVNRRPHAGTGTASSVAGIQQITVTSGIDDRFHPSTIVVHPGKVRIVLVNNDSYGAGPPHDLKIMGLPGAYVPQAGADQTREATFTAPAPGRYQFVCTIHERQGMIGTLVVTAG